MEETDVDIIYRINNMDTTEQYYIMEQILKLSVGKRIEYLSRLEDPVYYTQVISSLPPDVLKSALESQAVDINKININVLISLNQEFVEKSPDTILKLLNIDGDIDRKSEILMQISEENIAFLGDIANRGKLLSDRMVKSFSIDKISYISNFPDVMEKVTSFTDNELYVFSKSIELYQKNADSPEEWTSIAKSVMEHIDDYKEFINGSNVEELDVEKLSAILQYPNFLDIKNEEDFSKVEEKLNEKLAEDINSDDDRTMKNALVFKMFGFDLDYAEKMHEEFGIDSENLSDSDTKELLENLKRVLNINDRQEIKNFFEKTTETKIANKAVIERKSKNEYFKTYIDGLFDISQGKEVAQNVYEAGTDFNFIITSTNAGIYGGPDRDYYKKWNVAKNEVSHFCSSSIRNDMLGIWQQREVMFGFKNVDPSMLYGSKNMDIGSNMTPTFGISSMSQNRYYTSDSQINNTVNATSYNSIHGNSEVEAYVTGYNEMDIAINHAGKRQQPDYLIVFRKDGKIINGDYALKAQKDFINEENPGGLPIVIIDKDECLISEKNKLLNLIEEYKRNPNSEVEKKIFYNIRNNMQSDMDYLAEANINLEMLYRQGLMEENPDYSKLIPLILESEKEISYELAARTEKFNSQEKEVIGEPLQQEEMVKEENEKIETTINDIQQVDDMQPSNVAIQPITKVNFFQEAIKKAKSWVRASKINTIIKNIRTGIATRKRKKVKEELEKQENTHVVDDKLATTSDMMTHLKSNTYPPQSVEVVNYDNGYVQQAREGQDITLEEQ